MGLESLEWTASEKEKEGAAWYRKYRPKTLGEYAGEELCAKVRRIMAPSRAGHYPHIWMLQGTHGCGKTTLSRILTKYYLCTDRGPNGEPCEKCEYCQAINNSLIESGKDDDVEGVYEVNASEVTGKDGLLEVYERACESTWAKYNILILDEIQKASDSAQNALLKKFEDSKDDLIVIMATTEPTKVLDTVKSRVQVTLNIRRHTAADVAARMETILNEEGISYDKGALDAIAAREHGIFRESLNRLEFIVSNLDKGSRLTKAAVDDEYNRLPDEFFIGYLKNCRECNLGNLVLSSETILGHHTPLEFVSALGAFVAEGLECVYGKLSAGKKTKEFMSTLTDQQSLRLIRAISECREMLLKSDNYDENIALLDISASIYTKVFAPLPTGGLTPVSVGTNAGKSIVAQAIVAGEDALNKGSETFREKVLTEGHGEVTAETDDDDDPY